MIELAWPWALAALPLPLLIAWLSPRSEFSAGAALRVPFFGALDPTDATDSLAWMRLLAGSLAWLLLVAAASRPQWVGEPMEIPVSGRDLLLAVDISGSMRIEDMVLDGIQSSRLQVVQAVGGEFIERRAGDRLGLILFGSQAYLQTPLTLDRTTVKTLLAEAEIGLAGKETAIGDAIGLAVKRLRREPDADKPANPDSQVLVLLTDGANNAGEVQPLQAAELAVQVGLRIYTIGVGADQMVVRGTFGSNRVNPSSDLDEATLTQIGDSTGGRYFRARDTGELEQIYRLLDELEPVVLEDEKYRPTEELYPWPLALTLFVSIAIALTSGGWRGNSPATAAP